MYDGCLIDFGLIFNQFRRFGSLFWMQIGLEGALWWGSQLGMLAMHDQARKMQLWGGRGTAEILPALTGVFPSPPKPPSIPELKLHDQLQTAKAAFRHPSKIILNENSKKNEAHAGKMQCSSREAPGGVEILPNHPRAAGRLSDLPQTPSIS